MKFEGLCEDSYRFMMEIAFRNERSFFEENKERYETVIKKPMLELASMIAPSAGEINPDFNLRPSSIVSRIRRDTRFSKDKSLYRDHVWLAFKLPGSRLSENFTLYVEFSCDGYGYGMGMYGPMPALMRDIRARINARPAHFQSLINESAFSSIYTLKPQPYKRPKFTDAPEDLLPYLNSRYFSLSHHDTDLKKTMCPDVAQEIITAFNAAKPVYRFLMGLE